MPPSDFLPARGASRGLSLNFSVARELTSDDILSLAAEGESHSVIGPPPLQRVKAIHHHTARLVASGKTAIEVANTVGLTPQRVRDLSKDPAFRELVDFYMNQINDEALAVEQRVQTKSAIIVEAAIDEIKERLDNPAHMKALPVSELRQIAKDFGDRSILPPKQIAPAQAAPVQVTFNIPGRGLSPQPGDEAKDITESSKQIEGKVEQ